MNTSQFLQTLLEKVDSNSHSEFEVLYTYEAFIAAKTLRKVMIKFTKAFTVDAWRYYYEYLAQKTKGLDNLPLLAAHKYYLKCADFYSDERKIYEKELSECQEWIDAATFADYLKFKYGEYDRRLLGSQSRQ